jgi:hypothetical protein
LILKEIYALEEYILSTGLFDFPTRGDLAMSRIEDTIEAQISSIRGILTSEVLPKLIDVVLQKTALNQKSRTLLDWGLSRQISQILVSSPSKIANQKVQELLSYSNLNLPSEFTRNLVVYLQPAISFLHSMRHIRSAVNLHSKVLNFATDDLTLISSQIKKFGNGQDDEQKEKLAKELVTESKYLQDFVISDLASLDLWMDQLTLHCASYLTLKFSPDKGLIKNEISKELPNRGSLNSDGLQNYKKRFKEISYYWLLNEIIDTGKLKKYNLPDEFEKTLTNSVFVKYQTFLDLCKNSDTNKIYNYLLEKSSHRLANNLIKEKNDALIDINQIKSTNIPKGDLIVFTLNLGDRKIAVETNSEKISTDIKEKLISVLKLQRRIDANQSPLDVSVQSGENFLRIVLQDNTGKDFNKIINLIELL